MEQLTSEKIRALYKGAPADEHVFTLTDYPGIQIVRKYKFENKQTAGKRMFIKFVVPGKEGPYVYGGVDMVSKDEMFGGWKIETNDGLFRKPSNFSFREQEDVVFDTAAERVIFQKKKYSIDEFINLLERNHARDMFFYSRIANLFKLVFLHVLFFLVDKKYKRFDYFWEEGKTSVQTREQKTSIEGADPFFHYFNIYKNLLGIAIIVLLPLLGYFSLILTTNYFSVSNPALLFGAVAFLYLLDKASQGLEVLIKKTAFVKNLTRSSLEERGRLKPY